MFTCSETELDRFEILLCILSGNLYVSLCSSKDFEFNSKSADDELDGEGVKGQSEFGICEAAFDEGRA